ncbi:MAG: L,D-transpeptidase [Pseudomonadota bacterium]
MPHTLARMSPVKVIGAAIALAFLTTSNASASFFLADRYNLPANERAALEQSYTRGSSRKVPERFNRRVVSYKENHRAGTIVVDTKNKYLYHVIGNGKAWRYGVGVGKAGFTWSGAATIKRKAEWPAWHPPAAMRARERAKGRILPVRMEGGIRNPLGARALYLYQGGRDTLYRIHGTNDPGSIGLNVSSGCIRLRNEDVEHLYQRVKLGSRVVVR